MLRVGWRGGSKEELALGLDWEDVAWERMSEARGVYVQVRELFEDTEDDRLPNTEIDMAEDIRRETRTRLPSLPFPLSLPSPLHHHAHRAASAWASAVKSASAAVVPPPLTTPPLDPLKIIQQELLLLRTNITTLLGAGHPSLDRVAKYYFAAEGKQVRPLIVLLIAQATNGLSPDFPRLKWLGERTQDKLDDPLTGKEVLNDYNPHMPESSSAFSAPFLLSPPHPPSIEPHPPPLQALAFPFPPHILPTQRRLAEITEMIHVASLLHDDVVDSSPTRRNAPSAPAAFGNKLSVLGGDFLLGRASAALARLGSLEVVELLATVISNLVEGELMQMRPLALPDAGASAGMEAGELFPPAQPQAQEPQAQARLMAWQHYMQKTYLKTASLMAKSARAGVILGGGGRLDGGIEVKDVAYAFGRNLGIAFQLVDDMLDFTSSAATLGKPSDGADLRLGLATAPALFAWEEHKEMGELVARKFEKEGDVPRALELIHTSSSIPRTRELAEQHVTAALDALSLLPESGAREALRGLSGEVLLRSR
ncbi:terpenoid synthase [Dacryopinax primogenitus]|uniref:(2E,6E)-farnesyl diphosphate synthase n=1 Tax=Dacryopinax primogenitus (strain DJM 731) TaxID=1858805 RepID=M5G3I2_DACPD|nr:terpenoid synthase [Dacryopinax primogenitus]EJU02780.1 terpenoid synthase [Dacryopinax primogenitus]